MSLVSDATCVAVSTPTGTVTSSWQSLWKLLGRTTSSGRMIPAIDGLRCLAILAVIFHHLGGYVAHRTPGLEIADARQTVAYRVTNVGNHGVQLFFVISGFILAVPFAEQPLCSGKSVSLRQYFRRRLTRLHPPYLINLALMSLVLWWVKQLPWSELGPHLLASSVYLHNILYHSMSTVNGVAWSLEIEVQFYLLAPLLACVYRIPNSAVRYGLFGTAIATLIVLKWAAGNSVPYPWSGNVLYYLDYFLCGMLLADWQVTSPQRSEFQAALGIAWDVIGILCLLGCLVLVLNDTFVALLPLVLLPFCVAVLRGPRLNAVFSLPVLVAIGGMCYTTYLYHFAVISLVGRPVASWTTGCSFPVALAIQSVAVIPAILCVSAVLYLLIEKPFMQRRIARQPAV